MWNLLKTLLPPLWSLFFVVLAGGFFSSFLSIRLEMEAFSSLVVGVVISSLYLGILIGALVIDKWILRLGHVRSCYLFTGALLVLSLLQIPWVNPWYWAVLRFFAGVFFSGLLILIESWLLIKSSPNQRGAALCLYLLTFYIGSSLGQLFLDASDLQGIFPYIFCSCLLAFSLLPMSKARLQEPVMSENSVKLTPKELFQISPYGFAGGVVAGILSAGSAGLGPLYAKGVGMEIFEISIFMTLLVAGGLSLQWPIGRLGDRKNRKSILVSISFLASFLGSSFGFLENAPLSFHFVLAFLFGAFSFTIYPLSMAFACERAKENQLVAISAGFILSYGVGAVSGPLLASIPMKVFGPAGLFYFFSIVTLLLALIGLKKEKTIPEK